MSQPFTSIYNKMFSLRPTLTNIACHFLPVRKSNINNFHNFHFLTLEVSSCRHKKTSYINHFLR